MSNGLVRGYTQHLVSPSPGQGRTNPLDRGLVGEWRFDLPTGLLLLDYSGYMNHGTLVNGPTWVAAERGMGLGFDGSDYVDCGGGQSLDIEQGSWTYMAWAKAIAPAADRMLFGRRESGTDFFMMGFTSGGNVYLEAGGLNAINTAPGFTPADGVWRHYVYLYDTIENYTRVYANGLEVAARDQSGFSVNDITRASATNIGTYISGTYPFLGLIDEVRIYSRALSVGEISALYQLGLRRAQPATRAWMIPWGKPLVAAVFPPVPATRWPRRSPLLRM